MAIVRVPIIVTGKGPETKGRKYKADLFRCECGGGAFQIVQINGQDHAHFVCLYCETNYCGTMTGKSCDGKGAIPIDN